MPDDEQVQKLTLETNLPEKMTEAADATRKLKDEQSALAAVMASIEKAGETIVISTDAGTASVRAQAMETAELVSITKEVTAAEEVKAVKVDAATQAFINQMRAAENMRGMLDEVEPAINRVAGDASGGEDVAGAGGGFGGLAKNVFKGERAFTALTSGGAGLARAGPMLESVTTAMGMTSGVGFAVVGLMYAVEKLLPHLASMFGLMDPEKAKAIAEQMERQAKAAERIRGEKSPEDAETAKGTADFLKGKGQAMSSGILHSLTMDQEGKRTEEEEAFARMIDENPLGEMGAMTAHPLAFADAMKSRMNLPDTLKKKTDDILARLGSGDPAAAAEVAQMASKRPGAFPAETQDFLASNTPEARAEASGADADLEAQDKIRQDAKAARFERAKSLNREERERKASLETGQQAASVATIAADKERAKDFDEAMAGADWDRANWGPGGKEEQKAAADAKRSKEKGEHDADLATARADKMNTPQAVNRRAQKEEHNEALGIAQQNHPDDFGAKEQAMMARHLEENYHAGYQIGQSFEQALFQAIQQTRTDIMRGVHARLNESAQLSQSRIEN